jgi:hypothetical protein
VPAITATAAPLPRLPRCLFRCGGCRVARSGYAPTIATAAAAVGADNHRDCRTAAATAALPVPLRRLPRRPLRLRADDRDGCRGCRCRQSPRLPHRCRDCRTAAATAAPLPHRCRTAAATPERLPGRLTDPGPGGILATDEGCRVLEVAGLA